jgi:hypothetical protein
MKEKDEREWVEREGVKEWGERRTVKEREGGSESERERE